MQTVKTLGLAFFVMWGAITCGSSSGSNATSGTVNGATLSLSNAYAIYSSQADDPNTEFLTILMSSSSSLCSLVQQNHLPKDAQFAELNAAVVDANGAQAPTAAGTFTVYTEDSASSASPDDAGNLNVAEFVTGQTTGDANCLPTTLPVATSGTVTLTTLGSRTANTVGSYKVTLNTNDVVSGSFTAVPCIVDAGVLDGNTQSTCE